MKKIPLLKKFSSNFIDIDIKSSIKTTESFINCDFFKYDTIFNDKNDKQNLKKYCLSSTKW